MATAQVEIERLRATKRWPGREKVLRPALRVLTADIVTHSARVEVGFQHMDHNVA